MTKIADYHQIDLDKPLDGVIYERSNHIATITLNRPDRGNALAPNMHAVMRAIWTDVRENDDIRVAIIQSSGEKHFCTGFDVDEADSDEVDDVFNNRPAKEAVFWSPHQNGVWKPVICAVNGLVVGGGLHFVVDSDIVLASKNVKFMDTHVNIGMVGAVENIGLAKRLPMGMALRMTLMGKAFRLPAERAYQVGLVDELVETPADVGPAARAMAEEMLKNSPQAMALSKQAMWESMEQGYSAAMENGWRLLKLQWSHPDFEEGPKAFGQRRAPNWDPNPNARIGDKS